jgi:hypothetical protein
VGVAFPHTIPFETISAYDELLRMMNS